MEDTRFALALARFDAANADDPEQEDVNGQRRPRAMLYGERMSAWLVRLRPDAPEALRLAARAQHLRRWEIPRERYPLGREGYKAWRSELMRFHAEQAGQILAELSYEPELIERVQALLRKEQFKRDADAQTLEDVACLVFLAFYFEPFAAKHSDDKVIDILRKTWRKMSGQGRAAALELELSPRAAELVGAALEA